MQKYIVVQLQYEGVHSWPECPIEQVSYLRNPHRHIFHIVCEKQVFHNEREIEIISFKKKILDFLDIKNNHDFKDKPCETIAEELLIAFDLSKCTVLEDGENGAIIVKD